MCNTRLIYFTSSIDHFAEISKVDISGEVSWPGLNQCIMKSMVLKGLKKQFNLTIRDGGTDCQDGVDEPDSYITRDPAYKPSQWAPNINV